MSHRHSEELILLGRTSFRSQRRLFGLRQSDRRHHVYLVGQTGTGKSTLLHTMMRQDLESGRGFGLIDPHGDLVERLTAHIPAHRADDVTYFNVPDPTSSFAFNPLACTPETRALAAAGVLDVFKKLWRDSWGPRLEHLLRYALLALVEVPGSVLADVLQLLDDDEFRRDAARQVENEQVRRFWLREYDRYSPGRRAEAIGPIQNKVGAFLAHPRLRQTLGRREGMCDLRQLMDSRRVLLVNLAKGRLGDDPASLFGALLVSTLGRVGLERANQPEADRADFTIYLDEFHSFMTLSLAEMLAELRKYRVSVVVAHQYLAQLDGGVREAVLGNVGTVVTFRMGPADAKLFAPLLGSDLTSTDLMRLPNHHAYMRLLVDGMPAPAFSAEVLRI